MKKPWITVILVAFAGLGFVFSLCPLGCSSGGSTDGGNYYSESSNATVGSVKGLITSSITGEAIQGVTVTVGSQQTATDSEGHYQFLDVPAGSCSLNAEKTGFQNYSSTIQVDAGAVTFGNVVMTTVNPSGAVTGRVTDQINSKPLENVTITSESIETTTDKDGYYTLSGLLPGSTAITAKKQGFQDYTGSVTVEQSKAVVASFQMQPLSTSGSVAGIVTDQNSGAPLQNVTISMDGVSVLSDLQGRYQITGIEAGQKVLTATRSGYSSFSATVEIKAASTMYRNIQLTPDSGPSAGAVTGFVYDKDNNVPIEDVVVSTGSQKTSTDGKGHYYITGISPGQYTITAQKDGYTDFSGNVTVTAGQITSQDIELVPSETTGTVVGVVYDSKYEGSSESQVPLENVKVSIGSTDIMTDRHGFYRLTGVQRGPGTLTAQKSGYVSTSVDVTVDAGKVVVKDIPMTAEKGVGIVEGIVTSESGNDLVDVKVSIGANETETNEDGYYMLTGVKSGSQLITAQKSGYYETEKTVSVPDGDRVECNITMTPLPSTGAVSGFVTDAENPDEPLKGAIVFVGFRFTTSDSKGYYEFDGLDTGKRKVYAVKHAYFIYSGEVEIKENIKVNYNIAMKPFTIRGTVKGKVTDAKSGNAIENALVILGFSDTRTDDQGNYSLKVIAGFKEIMALKHMYWPFMDFITVTAGETLTYNISLSKSGSSGSVAGTIKDSNTGKPLEDVRVAVGSSSVMTDAKGAFSVSGIPAGAYTLVASKPGYQTYRGSVTVQSDADAAMALSMTPDSLTGSVSGTVTDKTTGTPVQNALVSIESTEIETDSEGKYQLTGIREGDRTFRVEKTGYESASVTVAVKAGSDVTCDIKIDPLTKAAVPKKTVKH